MPIAIFLPIERSLIYQPLQIKRQNDPKRNLEPALKLGLPIGHTIHNYCYLGGQLGTINPSPSLIYWSRSMPEENSSEAVQTPKSVPRLGFIDNVLEALKHVRQSVKNQGGRVRSSDYLSILLVPVTCVALLAASLCASWARLLVSLLALCSVLFYVLARIGIMRTLTERQAALIWHILMATFLMGITFAFVFLEILNSMPS